MSRSSLGTATLDALAEDTRRAIAFLEIQLDSGTERVHSWLGPIVWGGNTWTGAGDLASIEEVAENDDTKPDPLRVSLNGLTPEIVDMIDTQDIYRRPVFMYLGALDADLQLIEDPGLIFSGYAQNAVVSIGDPEGDTVLLESESDFMAFLRPRNVIFSAAQLQSEYPGDLGLEHIHKTIDSKTVWRGRNKVRAGSEAVAALTSSGFKGPL